VLGYARAVHERESERRGARARRWRSLVAGLGLVLAGCGPTAPPPPALEVTQFRQERAERVLLNEPLVVHFSEALDPRSVTRESVRVLDAEGAPVVGEVEATGRRLAFHPRLPLAPDLGDGGFLPDRSYSITLRGFPRVDALRSLDGAPLVRTFRSTFTTVDARGSVASGPVAPGPVTPGPDAGGDPAAALGGFLDDAPERRAQLSFERLSVVAGEPWSLVADKAIDPRSVSDARFVLASLPLPQGDGLGAAPIPLRATLVAARPLHARIELMPLDPSGLPRLLEVGEYLLVELPEAPPLRDLGAAPVVGPWATVAVPPTLVVEPPPPPPIGRRLVETFATTALSSPRVVEGAVGQARWEGDGRVRLSCPRASGDGRDGAVALAGDEPRGRVRATDLVLERGEVATLSSTGAVVLSAQGRVTVSGRLERRVQEGAARRGEDESHQDWLLRIKYGDDGPPPPVEWLAFEQGETLSEFLERAREAELGVTCIVCGGDIVIDGVIDVDGPLVLVAGGRVRIPGTVRASEAWITEPFARSGVNAWLEPLAIEVDQPLVNELVHEQRWSIVSGPLRAGDGFSRWGASRATGYASPGEGSRFEVRFVGNRRDAVGRLVETEPVADLRLLEDCSIVRLRIDLVVEAAGSGPPAPWNPPWLDDVELIWE